MEPARMRAPAPIFIGALAVAVIGPTIIIYGSEEQKKKHIRKILAGEEMWCQGFSAPGSGSDLASVQTRAVKDGDDYVINGQKIWTTLAHMSQYMLLLARTDPDVPKHKGLSYFIVPMNSPGVTVRPLMNMAGTHEFNEVFFDNVRIPAQNLVGEENRGWYQAVTTLDIERSNIGSAVGQQQNVEDLIKFARDNQSDGVVRIKSDPALRTELAERYLETEVAMSLSARVVSMQAKGMIPNYEASAVKLYSMELNQRMAISATTTAMSPNTASVCFGCRVAYPPTRLIGERRGRISAALRSSWPPIRSPANSVACAARRDCFLMPAPKRSTSPAAVSRVAPFPMASRELRTASWALSNVCCILPMLTPPRHRLTSTSVERGRAVGVNAHPLKLSNSRQ